MQERIKFLLLMLIEALFLLLLISRKLLQVTTLLHIQSVVLLLLMGTEGCPVMLPPRLVEIILLGAAAYWFSCTPIERPRLRRASA